MNGTGELFWRFCCSQTHNDIFDVGGNCAAEVELIIAIINYIPASTDIKKSKPILSAAELKKKEEERR